MDIEIEHGKFVKKCDKSYNVLMFMSQNFTENPFTTSEYGKNLTFIRFFIHM